MQAMAAAWHRFSALCATLIVALSLTAAPAVLAMKHGPGALAAEADHLAFHAEQGHLHEMPTSDHHDSSVHDHVGAALLAATETAFQPAPERTLRPVSKLADGTIRDGPRRPPRLTVT
ncbi:MAG: hypothetical protein ACKVPY_06790 [Paracoccaceae bacterium]